MGAREHERAAAAEETHAGNSALIEDHLGRCGRGNLSPQPSAPCWTAGGNAGAADARRERERQLRVAAAHRAAALALRDAESRSCVGIGAADRDVSPFLHTEDIAGVEALNGRVLSSRGGGDQRLQGATVIFRAVPGLTAEWLQRVIDCHVVRNAVLGYGDPVVADCPLGVQGVTATVRPAGGGFAVEMRGNPTVAEQILRRARAMVTAQPSGDASPR